MGDAAPLVSTTSALRTPPSSCPDRTQLLVGGLITLEIEVGGNELSFDVSYRLTSINRPVRFPA